MPRLFYLNFCVLSLAAPVCFAQAKAAPAEKAAVKAPAKVEKALRARAEEFLQDYVNGTFSRAYDLVADDSRDQFLGTTKEKIADPKITGIEFSDKNTKATVSSTVVRKANLGMAGVRDIPGVRIDSWRLEKGKWVWYFDPTQQCIPTLLGDLPCSKQDLSHRAAAGKAPVIPEKITPEAIAERMKQMNRGSGFNKGGFSFVKGVAGQDQLIYHNGLPGEVRISIDFATTPHNGYELEPTAPVAVEAYQDAVLKLSYSPENNPPDKLLLVILIEPFGQVFNVPVKVMTAEEAAKLAPAKPQ